MPTIRIYRRQAGSETRDVAFPDAAALYDLAEVRHLAGRPDFLGLVVSPAVSNRRELTLWAAFSGPTGPKDGADHQAIGRIVADDSDEPWAELPLARPTADRGAVSRLDHQLIALRAQLDTIRAGAAAAGLHVHSRACDDDAGPGHGVSLICELLEGQPEPTPDNGGS